MGKYTNLAKNTEVTKPQQKPLDTNFHNTYKHSILLDTTSNTVTPSPDSDTNLRSTNLTNLTPTIAKPSVVPCIHRMGVDKCAVCSGYVRWLIKDEARVLRAQHDPTAVRLEFWRHRYPEDRERADLFKQAVLWLEKKGGEDAVMRALGDPEPLEEAWQLEMTEFREALRERVREALAAERSTHSPGPLGGVLRR